MSKKRFEVIYSQGTITPVTILRDKETGVNYIIAAGSTGGSGLTPLLDSNGNVVVTHEEDID
ncbi:MAG: xylan 1,4-beta-xylosidase [Ruminococcus sp.]|nr:xylan 1,4-beta-xylosidase [Ruminococcus sp.]